MRYLIKTNKDKLVKTAVLGEVTDPFCAFVSTWDGKSWMLAGMGGIKYNFKIGDPCYGWASVDHVEAGVVIQGKEKASPSATALANLACIGNEALVVSGDAKGAKGYYTGRHAGLHDFCWFPDEDIPKLQIEDKVQVKAWGIGLQIEGFEDVKVNKLSPTLLEKMHVEIVDKKLMVPVTMEVPGYLMGSGIGFAPITTIVDYDIQTTCPEVVEELGLKKLRIGDIVALKDQACIYGRGRYRGALTVGVIVHGFSEIAGHGPGVVPILSSLNGNIMTSIDLNANIALYLELREKL